MVEIIESYSLPTTPVYIIAIIKSANIASIENKILEDLETQKQWQVGKRISYLSSKALLTDESEPIFARANIRPVEKWLEFIENIKERERNGIFEYKLNPIGHDEKPQLGVKLCVL